MNTKKTKRNYGLDVLRLLAMFFVVVLHSLSKSGVLKAELVSGKMYSIAWFLEIFCYGAVDIFALVSGYVGFREKKHPLKARNILRLWTQAVFYGVASYVIILIVNRSLIQDGDLAMSVMPVLHRTYWYLTAYIVMYLTSPLIEAGIREMSKIDCRKAIWLCFGIFSLVQIMAGNIFQLDDGYSAIWLIILYFMGGAMKKGELLKKFSIKQCCIGILACVVVTWVTKIFGTDFQVLGFSLERDFLVNYTSPTIVLASLLFVRLFAEIKIEKRWLVRVIEWATPCAFAVYLLNCNLFMWRYYLEEWLAPVREMRILVVFSLLILFSVAFFVAAILIEKSRSAVAARMLAIVNSVKHKRKSV